MAEEKQHTTQITDKQKKDLEDLVVLLRSIRGRHTELVSVLIPAETNIYPVVRQLEAEASTADNIKSKQTRTAVITAIESIIRELKGYKQTPKNGLALYCGNISETEGKQDIKLWAIEPPKPLRVRTYRCDQVFVVEPLQEMLDVDEVYGLLVMDRKEATIGVLEGKQIKLIRSMTSNVPGKYKTGGQSAARFERIRDGMALEFFKRVSENMKEIFFDMPKLKGILVGGPIPTKEEYLRDGELVTKLKNMVIAIKDIGYTDEHGLELLVEAAQEDIAQQEIIKEKKVLEKFFETLGRNRDKATYGYEKVKIALERSAVDLLLVSKQFDKDKATELEALAVQSGAEMVIVSVDNQDGDQFNNLTKGVGALLRYAFE